MTTLIDYVKSFEVRDAIANVRASDWAIGSNNDLLLETQSAADWDYFIKTSKSYDVILMGSKTADSISDNWRKTGVVLKGRNVVVASRSKTLSPNTDRSRLLICGGQEIYEQCLTLCTVVFLTVTDVPSETKADAYFPKDLLNGNFYHALSTVPDTAPYVEFRIYFPGLPDG